MMKIMNDIYSLVILKAIRIKKLYVCSAGSSIYVNSVQDDCANL